MSSAVKKQNPIPAWIAAPLAIGGFLALLWFERKRPLRAPAESRLRHGVRNAAVAGVGGIVLQLIEAPVVYSLLPLTERKGWGLVPRLPRALRWTAGLLFMDYTMYLWHVLMHCIPTMWRFHLAHHSDVDLDTTTALRFHFGELLLSVPWRAGQIVLIGLTPGMYATWQLFFLLSILFHHSDVRLPLALERRLAQLLVTPRMHAIHHSIVHEETDSNWSSGLSIWDRLHGTLRLNVPQDEVTIGVPALRGIDDVTFSRTLAMPFDTDPDSVWTLPDGETPERTQLPAPATELVG